MSEVFARLNTFNTSALLKDWLGLVGKAGQHLPHHASLVAKLGEARSSTKFDEVRRSSTKFGGKEKRNMLNPLSLVVAEENDMVHHHVSNLQQKLGNFENLKSF